MKYLMPKFEEVKQQDSEEVKKINGNRELFLQMLKADVQGLNTDSFLRCCHLFSKVKDQADELPIKIEDADMDFVNKKLEAFVSSLRGFTVEVKAIPEFIETMKSLPSELPKE